MKSLLVLIFAGFCIGCETTAKIGPMPNVAPVQQSNEATQKNIKALKEQIKDLRAALKEAKKSGQSGDKNLQTVGDDLDKLLKGK
jgi:septal ring factor EnvC (AmiA/AmiB activator)